MTVHADFLSDAVVDRVSSGLLRIQDTQWGFIVEEAVSDAGEMVADTLFKFVAFAALFGAGAQWLLPGSLFSGDVLVMKLGLSAVLVATALWMLRHATHAGWPELQVDAVRREIRVAIRTAEGMSRVRSRIAMHDIEECFVRRSGDDATELCFRVMGHEDPVRIASGTAADLAPVLERLTRDLRTPRERVALRMAV